MYFEIVKPVLTQSLIGIGEAYTIAGALSLRFCGLGQSFPSRCFLDPRMAAIKFVTDSSSFN
jgi:hypothetical protein